MTRELAVATEIAREAGALLLDHLRRPLNIAQKGRRADIVTDADRASERLIVERLRAAFPDCSIVGEESGTHAGDSGDCWYVDPLDGTTNYAHDYPMYCVSIGLVRDGEAVCGIVYAPHFDELFAAEKGAGATLNAESIGVSGIASVGAALTCTGFHPADYARNGSYFERMSGRAQAVRRDGSAALDLAFVAAGRFDAFWEFDLHSWDVAAGTILIREAGGRVTAADGAEFHVDGRSILATNGAVHEEMLQILKEAAPGGPQ